MAGKQPIINHVAVIQTTNANFSGEKMLHLVQVQPYARPGKKKRQALAALGGE